MLGVNLSKMACFLIAGVIIVVPVVTKKPFVLISFIIWNAINDYLYVNR